jgi:hypothetical protein
VKKDLKSRVEGVKRRGKTKPAWIHGGRAQLRRHFVKEQ